MIPTKTKCCGQLLIQTSTGKDKVKLSLCLTELHAVKTWDTPWCYMEVCVQLHFPAALLPGKEPLIPTRWEAEWGPEPVWMQ